MAPAESLSCFDWRPMDPAPDPHDEVYVRYAQGLLIGCWYGGYLYVRWAGQRVLIIGNALAWAPLDPDLVITTDDIRVYG